MVISSFAIYNTACILADGLVIMSSHRQAHFESTLLQYLWIFSIITIVIGSLIQFYFTRKLLNPLRALIHSTKLMKKGHYPSSINVKSKDEIGELIDHFNGLVAQLKENETHRQKLVSDLSHEFRTPLSNLSGYLNALKNGVVEADEELYQSLYGESKRLIKLVEQMEQLKEWDYVSKQTFSERTQEDMAVLVSQSIDMFRWTLKKTTISVDLKLDSGIVNVSNGGISQVISNLIDNAIRYYDGNSPIMITGEKRKNDYKLSISGPGQTIPIYKHNRIFERFYRIEHLHSNDYEGTGLGLAISKEIIEHHHGSIGIESIGNYHTFWFVLPLVD